MEGFHSLQKIKKIVEWIQKSVSLKVFSFFSSKIIKFLLVIGMKRRLWRNSEVLLKKILEKTGRNLFVFTIKDLKPAVRNQIEAIFGECTDVLNSLLEYLNKYNYFFKFLNFFFILIAYEFHIFSVWFPINHREIFYEFILINYEIHIKCIIKCIGI